MSKLPILSIVSAVSLVAASCAGPGDRSARGDAGGTVIISVAGDPQSIFPPLVVDGIGANVREQLYDRLAELGDDLNTIGDKGFTPQLADRWEWARDSLSIAFHIDPKARWHDGQPVRASDVRYSFGVNRDPRVGSSVTPLLSNIDSVSVRDSLTAIVWFKQRRPEQFYDFVYQVFIVPEHVFKGVPDDQLRTSDLARGGIGSGRFRLARWNAGQRIELVADTGNYRGRAKLDRVIWSIVPDAGAALAQLMSGQADVLEVVPADQIPRVDSSKTVHAAPYPSLQYGFMGMNLIDPKRPSQPHPIFGDRQVRRAVSMALDRDAMLKNVFGALGKRSYGPFPRSIGFGDTTLHLLPYDVNAAKALLDSAGWKETTPGGIRQKNGRPLRFSLLLPVSSRPRMGYAVLIQDQLRKVGAQVDLDALQINAAVQRQLDRNFDAVMHAQAMDPSPSGYEQVWSSAGAVKGGQNWVSYRNPTFDALLDSALATTDAAKMRGYMHRAFQIQIDDAPGVWLYDVPTVAGMHRRLKPAPLRADGWWGHLADWTIPPNVRIDRDRVGLVTTAR